VDPAVGAAAGAIGAATGLGLSSLTHGIVPAGAAACKRSAVVIQPCSSQHGSSSQQQLHFQWQQQQQLARTATSFTAAIHVLH
jgi:hypothetical protein